MSNKILKTPVIFLALIAPLFAFAEALNQTKTLLGNVLNIVNTILIPLVFTLGLLVFFWGMVKYIWGEGAGKDEGEPQQTRGHIRRLFRRDLEGEMEDEKEQRAEKEHGKQALAAAQLQEQVLPQQPRKPPRNS